MRRIFWALIILLPVLIVSLAGCGGGSSGSNDPFTPGGTVGNSVPPYTLSFISSSSASDPDGNLNTLSDTIPAGYVGMVTFKQLVPFEVLDKNGIPMPGIDVTLAIYNTGRNPDTVITLVPPLPALPDTTVTIRTDDHGIGIVTCNVSLAAPGDGLTNTESVVYQATANIGGVPLSTYGGFIVTIKQEKP